MAVIKYKEGGVVKTLNIPGGGSTSGGGGALEFIGTYEATAASSLDIPLPAGYAGFRLMSVFTFSETTWGSTTGGVAARMGSGSVDTGTNYEWARLASGTSTGEEVSTNATEMLLTLGTSAMPAQSLIDIPPGYDDSSQFTTITADTFNDNDASDANVYQRTHSGRYKTATAVDSLQLFPLTGTFTGKVHLFGYRLSAVSGDGSDGGYKGAWDNATDYVAGDTVTHNSSLWGATSDPAVADEPGVAVAWSEISTTGSGSGGASGVSTLTLADDTTITGPAVIPWDTVGDNTLGMADTANDGWTVTADGEYLLTVRLYTGSDAFGGNRGVEVRVNGTSVGTIFMISSSTYTPVEGSRVISCQSGDVVTLYMDTDTGNLRGDTNPERLRSWAQLAGLGGGSASGGQVSFYADVPGVTSSLLTEEATEADVTIGDYTDQTVNVTMTTAGTYEFDKIRHNVHEAATYTLYIDGVSYGQQVASGLETLEWDVSSLTLESDGTDTVTLLFEADTAVKRRFNNGGGGTATPNLSFSAWVEESSHGVPVAIDFRTISTTYQLLTINGGSGSPDGAFKGAWDNATDYVVGDTVTHNSSLWGATSDPAVADEPGVAAAWSEITTSGSSASSSEYCSIRLATNGDDTLPTATFTPVEFNTLVTETSSSMWDVANPSRITVPEDGQYVVRGSLNVESAAMDYELIAAIYVNGTNTTPSTWSRQPVGEEGAYSIDREVVGILDLTAGDYVELVGYWTGAEVDLGVRTGLTLARLGGAGGSGVTSVVAEWDGTGDQTEGLFSALRDYNGGANPLESPSTALFPGDTVTLPRLHATQSSDQDATRTAEKAADWSIDQVTGAAHTQDIANSWWKVDAGSGNTIQMTRLALMGRDGAGLEPRNFILQGSDDDTVWTDLLTVTADGPTDNGGWWHQAVVGAAAYRYIRIYQNGVNNGASNYLVLGEVEFYGTLTAAQPFATFTSIPGGGPDASGATAGQVWTADGSGGADWAAAGSGLTGGEDWHPVGDYPEGSVVTYDNALWIARGGGVAAGQAPGGNTVSGTYVGAGAAMDNGGGNSTETVGLPAGVQEGDLLVLFSRIANGTQDFSTAEADGWTRVLDDSNDAFIHWKVAESTPTAPTISGQYMFGRVLAFRSPYIQYGEVVTSAGGGSAVAPSPVSGNGPQLSLTFGQARGWGGPWMTTSDPDWTTEQIGHQDLPNTNEQSLTAAYRFIPQGESFDSPLWTGGTSASMRGTLMFGPQTSGSGTGDWVKLSSEAAFRGEWDNTTDYVIGDTVTYNGASYGATSDPAVADEPGTAATWSLINGANSLVEWNGSTEWYAGDLAIYNGRIWKATTNNSAGSVPTETTTSPPTFVGAGAAVVASGGFVSPSPPAVQSGDLLVMYLQGHDTFDGTVVTTPTGWTEIQSATRRAVYWRIADTSADDSPTISVSSNQMYGQTAAWRSDTGWKSAGTSMLWTGSGSNATTPSQAAVVDPGVSLAFHSSAGWDSGVPQVTDAAGSSAIGDWDGNDHVGQWRYTLLDNGEQAGQPVFDISHVSATAQSAGSWQIEVSDGGWQPLITTADGGFKGAWDNATDYANGDTVTHNSSLWGATSDPAVADEPGVAAAWSEISTSGGSGTTQIGPGVTSITSGNFNITATTRTDLPTTTEVTLDNVAAGDWVMVGASILLDDFSGLFTMFDAATIVSDAEVNNIAGTSTLGVPGWFCDTYDYQRVTGEFPYQLQAGDIDNGSVTFRLQGWNNADTRPVRASSTTPLTFFARHATINSGSGSSSPIYYAEGSANGTNYTTTSTTAVDLDATNLSVSVPASEGDILRIQWNANARITSADNHVQISAALNDTLTYSRITTSDSGLGNYHTNANDIFHTVVSGDLSAGEVPIKLQWRASVNGTAEVLNTAGTQAFMVVTNLGSDPTSGGGGGGPDATGATAGHVWTADGADGADWVSPPATTTVTAIPTFTAAHAAGVGGLNWYNDTGGAINVTGVRASISAAAVSAATVIDVNVDGTSALDSPLSIAVGQTTTGKVADSIAIPDGSYISIDIDSVGSPSANETVMVQFYGDGS